MPVRAGATASHRRWALVLSLAAAAVAGATHLIG
jgi:hypothetical protein